MADTKELKSLRVQLQYPDKGSTGTEGPTHTLPTVPRTEIIHDACGVGVDFELDRDGFCYVQTPRTAKSDCSMISDTDLEQEMKTLLHQKLDEYDEIVIIGVKHQRLEAENDNMVEGGMAKSAVVSLVRVHSEMIADHILAGRVRVINLWIPGKHAFSDRAMAVARVRYQKSRKDIAGATSKSSPPGREQPTERDSRDHDWYYLDGQTEEEALLLKIYDSEQSSTSASCLYTVFEIPEVQTSTEPKEYIEVRAMVFTYPEIEPFQKKRPQLEVTQQGIHHDRDLAEAVLNLRQWESRMLTERINHLLSDRDHARAETLSLNSQRMFLEDWIMNFYMSSISSPPDMLTQQIQHFVASTPRLRDRLSLEEQAYQNLRYARGIYGVDAELILLRQQLEAQIAENKRLKARVSVQVEAEQGDAFIRAVRRAVDIERLKDAVVIDDLRQTNERLRQELNVLVSRLRQT